MLYFKVFLILRESGKLPQEIWDKIFSFFIIEDIVF